jgi:acetoacetyl-CoA synthetase
MFPRPDFFEGTKLNFAASLLYPAYPASPNHSVDEDTPALISVTESSQKTTTFGELRIQVRKLSNALRAAGVQPHDRVAGFLGNHANAYVLSLSS